MHTLRIRGLFPANYVSHEFHHQDYTSFTIRMIIYAFIIVVFSCPTVLSDHERV